MAGGQIADALLPLRIRMRPSVQEREVLRVAASCPHSNATVALEQARREILAWAQRRCGGRLPQEAWKGQGFEFLAGGRTTLGVSLSVDGTDLWALRGDDPDKNVAGRIWTTEVVIGRNANGTPQLSLRLLVNTTEEELKFDPHVPGLLQQVASKCGLRVGGFDLSPEAKRVVTSDDVDSFISMLESPERRLPIFVASGDQRAVDPDRPLIDAAKLARATLGLAHVFVLPVAATFSLSEAVGPKRSVFHGAVRVYLPGFNRSSDPYLHRLFLGDTVRRDPDATVRSLQSLAATESLRRTRLGDDVLQFAAVRSATLQAEQARVGDDASEAQQLNAMKKSLEAITEERNAAIAEVDHYIQIAQEDEERARAAEAQYRGAVARIEQLIEALKGRGQDPDAGSTLPATWDQFAEWCDNALAGRLVLAPGARRGIRNPEFADVGAAARCLEWLAGTCRDQFMHGGGTLSNIPIEPGIVNAPCGDDTFRFSFQGMGFEADWHVKNGGNTRDPSRCLRIYYCWDETMRQIVVAEMPAHRRTGAT